MSKLAPLPSLYLVAAACSLTMASAYADEAQSASKAIQSIDELEIDAGAGRVSAASLAGVTDSAIVPVESARQLAMIIKGMGTPNNTVGIAITPFKTSFMSMNLSTYAKGVGYRLLGNVALSYAQGTSKIKALDYENQAVSIETGTTMRDADDPVLAVAQQCTWQMPDVNPVQANSNNVDFTQANKAYLDCVNQKTTAIESRWNTSRFSASYGTGKIKRADGASGNMGRTLAFNAAYGFDHLPVEWLKNYAALSATVRHTAGAIVLDTLGTADQAHQSTTTTALRLSGGSSIFRGLAEVSNVRTKDADTPSRLFRYALGVDYRIMKGTWVGFRLGKRRSVTNQGEETAALLDFSFSPQSKL